MRTFELIENPAGERVYAFDHNYVLISDPTVSECTRFAVDPAEYYGLSDEEVQQLRRLNRALAIERVLAFAHEHINANATQWDTGGGCTAIGIPRDDGGHWLITGPEGPEMPESIDASCAVGIYGKDGDNWVVFNCENLEVAAKLIGSLACASL